MTTTHPLAAAEQNDRTPVSAPAAPDYVDPARRTAFRRAGYTCIKDNIKKVALFVGDKSGREVYLINGQQRITVVIHPDVLGRAKVAAKEPFSVIDFGFFHHANLLTFPKRSNGGRAPIAYGRTVTCRTAGALEEFLIAFDAT